MDTPRRITVGYGIKNSGKNNFHIYSMYYMIIKT
jgi:hypothetical protein